jgi:hypothetical protein
MPAEPFNLTEHNILGNKPIAFSLISAQPHRIQPRLPKSQGLAPGRSAPLGASGT